MNNAGTSSDQTLFHELPAGIFTRIIDTNVKGLMLATHMAYNRMLKQGHGKIYNILANEADTVAPYLAGKKIENTRHGAKISWLNNWKVIRRFLSAPFSKKNIVSRYL